jgi:hypothetical protein
MKVKTMIMGLACLLACSVSVLALDGKKDIAGIEGRFTDHDGTPLGYVRVDLYDSGPALVRSMRTAADGTFRFAGLQPGVYQLQFSMPGAPPAWFGGASRTPIPVVDSIVTVDFSYPQGPGITGIYLDRKEQPLPFTQVYLYDSGQKQIDTVLSAGNGSFRFFGLRPGVYYLACVRAGEPTAWYGGASMEPIVVGNSGVSVEIVSLK